MSGERNSDITEAEWSKFKTVVTDVVKAHPQIGFLKSVALKLNEKVYQDYKVA